MSEPGSVQETIAESVKVISDAEDWLKSHSTQSDLRSQRQLWKVAELRRAAFTVQASLQQRGCLSIFGASQAGKSYVVDRLAAPQDGLLKVALGDENVEFVGSINPQGGEESTALVTRFSFNPNFNIPNPEFPVFIKVLSEADIIKVLINTYCSDIDHEQSEPDTETFNALVDWIDSLQPEAVNPPGCDSDDFLNIRRYLYRFFRTHSRDITDDIWEKIVTVGPTLSGQQRAKLVSIFWKGVPDITAMYTKLLHGLQQLGLSRTIYCKKNALLPNTESILKVSTLNQFLDDEPSEIAELLLENGEIISMNKALVACLAEELCLKVAAEKPAWPFLEYSDILDFPGARSRLTGVLDGKGNIRPIDKLVQAKMFLRGKVDLLFQNYLDERELTAVLVCVADSVQEVPVLPDLVGRWVSEIYGNDPDTRSGAGEQPTLFLNLTKFDVQLDEGRKDSADAKWNARFNSSLEHFERQEWFRQWGTQPFRNILCFRNSYEEQFFKTRLFEYSEANKELGVLAEKSDWIAQQKHSFVSNPNIVKHIWQPAAVWDGCLSPDGGLSYLSQRVEQVYRPDTKQRQLLVNITSLIDKVISEVEEHYVSDDHAKEMLKKQALVDVFKADLEQCTQHRYISAFFESLFLDEKECRNVLSRADRQLDVSMHASEPKTIAQTQAHFFCQHWVNTVTERCSSDRFIHGLKFDPAALKLVLDEIVLAAQRLQVQQELETLLHEIFSYKRPRQRTLSQRARVCSEKIAAFVRHLGLNTEDQSNLPKRLPAGTETIFVRVAEFEGFPVMREEEERHEYVYFADWCVALENAILRNFEFTEGREIDSVANAKLGDIIANLGNLKSRLLKQ